MFKRIELSPIDGRKSFYGKAYAEKAGNYITLYSYNTKICTYNTETGEIIKHPAFDYSMTTKRHQRAFFYTFGITA